MNFSKNSEKQVKTTRTSTTKDTPQKNKPAVNRTVKPVVTAKKTEASNVPVKKAQPNPVKAAVKIPVAAPVVAMTKTAQLRAKMASSNTTTQLNNTLNSSINNPVRSIKPKAPSAAQRVPRLKENINTMKTGSSVALNPHLDHLNRGGVRRKSFTCSSTSNAATTTPSSLVNKSLKKVNATPDTNVCSVTNSTNFKTFTTTASASAKSKANWK